MKEVLVMVPVVLACLGRLSPEALLAGNACGARLVHD